MKSAVAAMVKAAGSLKGKRRRRGLVLIATAGEEIGFDGLNAIIAAGKFKEFTAKYGVAGEPTEMRVVRAHKGVLSCRVIFEGRSADVSDPSLGVNSIENCILFVNELKRLQARAFGKQGRGPRAETLITPTMVSGGVRSNVIPVSCEVTLDCRLIPAHTAKTVLDGLKSIIGELGERNRDFKARIEILHQTSPLSMPESTSGEALRVSDRVPLDRRPLRTEASAYARQGIPCVAGTWKREAGTHSRRVCVPEGAEDAEAVYTGSSKKSALTPGPNR